MINRVKILFFILSISIFFLLFPTVAFAIDFILDEPTGPFSQEQEVQYTINIDTQGATLTSTETNMTYANYLEYISTSPGALFPNVSGTIISTGNLHLSASVNAGDPGVTGSGTFALVSFRLTGSPQSDVELCAIVTPTPTLFPTSPPQPTTPSQLITPICETTPPVVPPQESPPTYVRTLPRSGTMENLLIITALGVPLPPLGLYCGR